jgi:high-affinity iron transporter
MWQGFTIALREGIEAFLIVALTLAYLRRTGRPGLAKAVYAAIAVSVVTCSAAGYLFSKAVNQPLWEGILALVAAALVGSLLVYMKRVSKHLKSDIEARIESKVTGTPGRAFWGVFAFALLMITREGMETALLIATAFFQLKSMAVVAGLALGLVGAAVIGILWTRLGKDVDLKTILNVSAVFLGIFLVQLVLYGVHELSEARLFPASQAIHDATEILGPDGAIGHLLAYALAVIPTLWLTTLWWKRRRAARVAAAAPRVSAASLQSRLPRRPRRAASGFPASSASTPSALVRPLPAAPRWTLPFPSPRRSRRRAARRAAAGPCTADPARSRPGAAGSAPARPFSGTRPDASTPARLPRVRTCRRPHA